jgi:hypothetical protein
MRPGSSFRFAVLITTLLIVSTCAQAQMPPPRYTPNVDLTNAAYTRALARLPNGKLIIAGNDLLRVNGTAQNLLARLNADGSLDGNWNPAPDRGVGALWVDAAGMLYVGGTFTTISLNHLPAHETIYHRVLLDENF